ncbi:MAG: hypothetical protein AAF328_08160 [Planctomycetota bacterium]
MPHTWFDALEIQAEAQGQNPHVLRMGEARLLVVEHGARVLACELPGVDHNLFFTTDFSNQDGSQGKLTGGDRVWMSPEIAYFWPTLEDALNDPKGTAATPAEIDPAAWHNMNPGDEDRVELACGMSLTDLRSGRSGKVLVQREVIAERSGTADVAGLASLSFLITHSVEMQEGADSGFCTGAWDILQVPTGGTLICPTARPVTIPDDMRSYYEPFGDRHVVIDPACVRFRLDGRRRIKAGIKAEHTTGRMAYYRELGEGRSSLIVRIFAPMPGEPYCDVPRDDPRNFELRDGKRESPVLGGDCFQVYNDDGDAFGGGPDVTFGEMEYHDPCVVGGEGPDRRTGTSVSHVVAGPDAAVRAWGEGVLGCAIEALR